MNSVKTIQNPIDNFVQDEEDGDEIFTPMPEFCLKWPCCIKKQSLICVNGFMLCPICNGSYGKYDSILKEC